MFMNSDKPCRFIFIFIIIFFKDTFFDITNSYTTKKTTNIKRRTRQQKLIKMLFVRSKIFTY